MVVGLHRHAELDALAEDFSSAWIPDPLDGADFEALLERPNESPTVPTSVAVPRPHSGPMLVHSIGFESLVELHRAVAPLRATGESVLAPSVCGYRSGADAASYELEYSRFRSFVARGVEGNAWAGTTDVRSFFSSISGSSLCDRIGALIGDQDLGRLRGAMDALARSGISTLPAGYADARLLANLVLVEPDRELDAHFCRWVDDYRVFASSADAVSRAIERLAGALRTRGLHLNLAKTAVLSQSEARHELLGRDLASVYHPEFEASEVSRASLRSIFFDAAGKPTEFRRELRFVLPRLALEGDDVAVDFAINGLRGAAWEAPRLAAYLSEFREREAVSESLWSVLLLAAREKDEWVVARVAPAVAGTATSLDLDALVGFLQETCSPAVWAVALRALSLARHPSALSVAKRALDIRAALAAYADLDLQQPSHLAERAATTAAVLREKPAPPPSAASIL